MTMRVTFRLAMVFLLLQPNPAPAQSGISLAPTARVDEYSLSGLVSNPAIASFDLLPDGSTVALLVSSGIKMEAPLWVFTEDIVAKRFTAFRQLGHLTITNSGFAAQIRYSSDQRYLVVQNYRTIQVLDSKTLKSIRTISPPSGKESLIPLFITGASGRDIFVCAFGPAERSKPRFHTTPVQVEVVNISSGECLGEWSSGDVPQSISPNGELIAVSSLQPQNGVLPLDVVDVHGQKVAELTGGFAFKKAAPSQALGRVLGVFMGNDELLLSPDWNFDRTGHLSGESLQLISIKGKVAQVQQSVIPHHYASQGGLAVSANGRIALAVSWYVPPRYLVHEWALPASSPELLVFKRDTRLKLDATLPMHGLGLKASGWLESVRPRLSADGSTVAIAQDDGITVLTKTPISSQHTKERSATRGR